MKAICRAMEEYWAVLATKGRGTRILKVYGARLRCFADWRSSQAKTEARSLSAIDFRVFIAQLQANSNGAGIPKQNAVVVKAFSKWLVC